MKITSLRNFQDDVQSRPRCPVCKTFLSENSSLTYIRESIGKRRELAACQSCDHWFTFPPPTEEELDEFYTNTFTHTDNYKHGGYKRKIKRLRKVLESIDRSILSSPRILEHGPGPYGILPLMKPGQKYVAIEPCLKYHPYLQEIAERRGVDCTVISHHSIDLESHFDLAISIATLEHVANPEKAITSLRSTVARGGWLIIGIPDRLVEFPDSELVRKGLYQTGIDYCETHLHSFSQRSIELLYERAGVTVHSCSHKLLNRFSYIYYSKLQHLLESASKDRGLIKFAFTIKLSLYLIFHRIAVQRLLDLHTPGDDRCEIIVAGRID